MWEDSLAAIGDEPVSISMDEYASRQNRLFGQLKGTDLIIITNPKESVRSNDVHYHYRSSSDMLYLTGWKDRNQHFVHTKEKVSGLGHYLFSRRMC